MRAFFRETDIPPEDYFEFFKQYMDEGEGGPDKGKDLGKWKKIKFLGFEGPA